MPAGPLDYTVVVDYAVDKIVRRTFDRRRVNIVLSRCKPYSVAKSLGAIKELLKLALVPRDPGEPAMPSGNFSAEPVCIHTRRNST